MSLDEMLWILIPAAIVLSAVVLIGRTRTVTPRAPFRRPPPPPPGL